MYNLWFVIGRACFDELQLRVGKAWLAIDYFSDAIYLCDIGVRLRTGKKNALC